MAKEKPRPVKGEAKKKSKTTDPQHKDFFHAGQTPPSPRPARAMGATDGVDLVGLRDRLLATRARLLEQVANDWGPGRRYPDTSWCRMLADVQGALQAVDAVVAERAP